jgi:hypothetical protein
MIDNIENRLYYTSKIEKVSLQLKAIEELLLETSSPADDVIIEYHMLKEVKAFYHEQINDSNRNT